MKGGEISGRGLLGSCLHGWLLWWGFVWGRRLSQISIPVNPLVRWWSVVVHQTKDRLLMSV